MLTETDLQHEMVDREVHCCLSSLVATLARGNDAVARGGLEVIELEQLTEQALELASPVDDYEEAAIQAGYEIRHDMYGFYACTLEEAAREDAGEPSVGFDGRSHFATAENAARFLCDESEFEPVSREVFEFWAISDWLADKLTSRGEKVDRDFANLNVWARTTTGQAVSMDGVIREITQEIFK